MQHFLNPEIEQPDFVGKAFPPNVLGSYTELSEFTKLGERALGKALEKRMVQIRSLFS